jgi:hypothetical protein
MCVPVISQSEEWMDVAMGESRREPLLVPLGIVWRNVHSHLTSRSAI